MLDCADTTTATYSCVNNFGVIMANLKLYNGNCLDVLKNCPDNYMDSIVTDPPYGLSFMGKKWDYDVPTVDIWKECLRVLKPGGHLLAFGGTRTYHRLVVAIEDAGFEIRDQIQWIYGQGFPKSHDLSKAIDKEVGAKREVVGTYKITGHGKDNVAQGSQNRTKFEFDKYSDEPVSDEAKQWSGWGTALKPANEPICLARKPLSESTIAKNVLKHGTGGLNIDGGRIGTEPPAPRNAPKKIMRGGKFHAGADVEKEMSHYNPTQGRFPSNVILDEGAAQVLDEQVAQSVSRFFYQAKASKSDRGEGNIHPTVKPIKLMEYLIKLITPEGGIVLDPFMGSGTTGIAALRNGFQFRGIEMNEEYFKICEARISQVEK